LNLKNRKKILKKENYLLLKRSHFSLKVEEEEPFIKYFSINETFTNKTTLERLSINHHPQRLRDI